MEVLQDKERNPKDHESPSQAFITVGVGTPNPQMPEPPDTLPGSHCSDPVICEFFATCNQPLPDDHISYLPGLRGGKVGELEELGITLIRDIPDDFPLNERQRNACTSVKTGQAWHSEELPAELGTLQYPLYFMDFETVNPAIPRFPGMRPYDHIPFQWSVHVQNQPGTPPEHQSTSPLTPPILVPNFSVRCAMWRVNEEHGVYNASFESQRLAELALCCPELAQRIENVLSRLWDLLPVVRNNVYHPAFGSSYSLKSVLPALVPEMSYEGMDIADGQNAGVAWEAMVTRTLGTEERERIRMALTQLLRTGHLGARSNTRQTLLNVGLRTCSSSGPRFIGSRRASIAAKGLSSESLDFRRD